MTILRKRYADLTSEAINPRTWDIDQESTLGMLRLINQEDESVPRAVATQLPQIAQAVELLYGPFPGRPDDLRGRGHLRAAGGAGRQRMPAHLRRLRRRYRLIAGETQPCARRWKEPRTTRKRAGP